VPQDRACENGNSVAVSVETGFPFPLPRAALVSAADANRVAASQLSGPAKFDDIALDLDSPDHITA